MQETREMCLKVKLNLNYPQFIRQRMNHVRFTHGLKVLYEYAFYE